MDPRPSRRTLALLATTAGAGLAACVCPPTLPANPPPFQTSRYVPSPAPEDAPGPVVAASATVGGILPVAGNPLGDRGREPHLDIGVSFMPVETLRLSLTVELGAAFATWNFFLQDGSWLDGALSVEATF